MSAFYKMPGFTLANSNLSTKVLVTLFALSTLGGTWVAWLQYTDRAGTSAEGAAEWVLGNEGDLEACEFKSRKTVRELIAITHEHAFSLPILMFVLLHLAALTTVPEWSKVALYGVGFGSMVGSFAGPWLIHRYGPEWTPLLRITGSLMLASIVISCLLALWEMWLAGPVRGWRQRPEPLAPDPLFPQRRRLFAKKARAGEAGGDGTANGSGEA